MTLSFDQVKKRLHKNLSECKKGDLQAIWKVMSEHQSYCLENYNELDEETKTKTDEISRITKESVKEQLPKIPDSPEKRSLERTIAKLEHKHYNVSLLLASLEAKRENQPRHNKEGEVICEKIIQHSADLIYDGTKDGGKGQSHFACTSLLINSVDNLTSTLHLIKHNYSNQAINLIRNTHEDLEKITLFREQPEWAKFWVEKSPEEVWRELKPSKVKKKIGAKPRDEIYSLLSRIGTHTTFQSIQSRSAIKVENNLPKPPTNPQIVVWVGGTQLLYPIISTFSWLMFEALQLLIECGAVYQKIINVDEFNQMLEESFELLKKYQVEYLLPLAKDHQIDVTELKTLLESFQLPKLHL
jgi:hypothetical protein